MAANYSTNPKNPVNQAGGAVPAPPVIPVANLSRQPKTIREYLDLARAAGGAPLFSNNPNTPGMQVAPQAQPAQGAIPQAPVSEYEKVPFNQRVKMDPYQRAKMRLQDLMPQIWEQLFPGMAPGSILNEADMAKWQGAVAKVTSELVKKYDRQYGDYQKYEMQNQDKLATRRSETQRHWQNVYVQAMLKGAVPRDNEGNPISEKQFIEERMATADELEFNQYSQSNQGERQAEVPAAGGRSAMSFTPQSQVKREDIIKVLKDPKNKQLLDSITKQAMTYAGDSLGRTLTDNEFKRMFSSPEHKKLIDDAFNESIKYYQDKILKAM